MKGEPRIQGFKAKAKGIEIGPSGGITASFVNSRTKKAIYYVDSTDADERNPMELQIGNSGSDAIQFEPCIPSIANISRIPVLVQVDNILSAAEIEKMSLDETEADWSMEVLTLNEQYFWAVSPNEEFSLGAGDSKTILFSELRVSAKPIRSGKVQTQLNYKVGKQQISTSFQQKLILRNDPDNALKSLSDDLSVEFVSTAEQIESVNAIYTTPLKLGEVLKNTLALRLKNKRENLPLIDKPLESGDAKFFLSFPATDVPAGNTQGVATTDEINDMDVFIGNLSDPDYNWSIRKNNQNKLPFWILTPQNDEILGNPEDKQSDSIEFSISDIVTYAKPGKTQLSFSYTDVPGYLDGSIALPMEIIAYPGYVGSFFVNGLHNARIDVGGKPFTLKYSVFSLDDQQWEITIKEGESEPKVIHTFQSLANTGYDGSFDYTINSSGKYELTLKAVGLDVSKAVSVQIIQSSLPEIRAFTFADGSESKDLSVGGSPVTLDFTVFRVVDQNWVIENQAGKTIYSFTSKAGTEYSGNFSHTVDLKGTYSFELKAVGEWVSQNVKLNIESTPFKILDFCFEDGTKTKTMSVGGESFTLKSSVVSPDQSKWYIDPPIKYAATVWNNRHYFSSNPNELTNDEFSSKIYHGGQFEIHLYNAHTSSISDALTLHIIESAPTTIFELDLDGSNENTIYFSGDYTPDLRLSVGSFSISGEQLWINAFVNGQFWKKSAKLYPPIAMDLPSDGGPSYSNNFAISGRYVGSDVTCIDFQICHENGDLVDGPSTFSLQKKDE